MFNPALYGGDLMDIILMLLFIIFLVVIVDRAVTGIMGKLKVNNDDAWFCSVLVIGILIISIL